jgi:hypothetical protein
MNAPISPNDLTHDQIRAWLARALRGHEPLPRLTPDEAAHLGILRLEKSLKSATRDSLRDGCRHLVREFCSDGRGDVAYIQELLSLAAAFRDPETVQILAELARRFSRLPDIAGQVRVAVLAMLVDTPPPQPPGFWTCLLEENPESYASLALSGVLATSPGQAIAMLTAMPDTERVGQAAALKLDLAWDDLLPSQRFSFVQQVRAILPHCGSRLADAVRAWTDSKHDTPVAPANPGLSAALSKLLGPESAPRVRTSRLCSAA